jgi:hypothetical protein
MYFFYIEKVCVIMVGFFRSDAVYSVPGSIDSDNSSGASESLHSTYILSNLKEFDTVLLNCTITAQNRGPQ